MVVWKYMSPVSASGYVAYSQVRSFMKKKHMTTNMYKSFTSWNNNTFTLSGNHLIYARKSYWDTFMPM